MAVFLEDNVKSILKESTAFYSQVMKAEQLSQKDAIAYTLIYKMWDKNDFLRNLPAFAHIERKQEKYVINSDAKFKSFNDIKKYIESLLHRYKNEKMEKEASLLNAGIIELVFLFINYHPDIAKQLLKLDDNQYFSLTSTLEAKVLLEHTKSNKNPKNVQLGNNKFVLSKYGAENLTSYNYEYNPLVGNEQALKQAIKKILNGNSLIILGEAGVGKTTLVQGIAYNIKTNNVPSILKDKQIISLPVSGIIADTSYVGQLEKRIQEIINYAKMNRNSIFYIDEIHTIIGAGSYDTNKTDVADLLKPYISNGTMQIIGATTTKEYDKTIATDPAFRRRFRTMTLHEPTEEEVLKIAKHYISIQKQKTNIEWEYSDILLEKLINLTSSKNRSFFETVNNPNISLAIIDDIFASALYYEKDYVEKNDVIEGIQDNEILASTKKQKLIESLSSDELYDTNEENNRTKILKLHPYNNSQ